MGINQYCRAGADDEEFDRLSARAYSDILWVEGVKTPVHLFPVH